MPGTATHEPTPSQPAQIPLTSSQSVSAPAVLVPATSVPTVSVPTVSAPAVLVPATSVPTVSAPAVLVPPTSVPTVSAPAVSVPPIPAPPGAAPSSFSSPAKAPVERPEPIAACIDDLLGAARGRYFGEGYRRVGHEVRDVSVECAADTCGGIRALAWVVYPIDWAVKRAGVDLRPHVSSIDTLVIGSQLCEAFLVHRYGLDAGQRRRMWLRRIELKSGHRPQEELAGFEVAARYHGTRPLEDRPETHVSTFDCLIGTMRLRCEIGHEVNEARTGSGWYADLDQLLGSADRRYYGTGYRDSRFGIGDVSVAPGNTYAECTVRPAGGGRPTPIGMESDFRPAFSMVDSTVITAQLSQVLLYRTDEIDRTQSNNMWLRSVKMERPDPAAPWTGTGFPASIAVAKSRIVQLNGARWRIVDMVAYCQGIEQTHSLAHELPASADSATAESGGMRSDAKHQGVFR